MKKLKFQKLITGTQKHFDFSSWNTHMSPPCPLPFPGKIKRTKRKMTKWHKYLENNKRKELLTTAETKNPMNSFWLSSCSTDARKRNETLTRNKKTYKAHKHNILSITFVASPTLQLNSILPPNEPPFHHTDAFRLIFTYMISQFPLASAGTNDEELSPTLELWLGWGWEAAEEDHSIIIDTVYILFGETYPRYTIADISTFRLIYLSRRHRHRHAARQCSTIFWIQLLCFFDNALQFTLQK